MKGGALKDGASSDAAKRWSIPPSFTAAALGGHSIMGLACAALIYLVCVTGAVSVLVDELRLAEQPSPAAAAPAPGAIDQAVAQALARTPGVVSLYAVVPTTPRQRLTITAYGAREMAFIADRQGGLFAQKTPFADFVTDLHMTLTAPAPWGSLIVGLSGAALLSLILSGVLAHPRIFRDAFRLRLNRSPRLREAELHNRLSVWGLPFHIAVTLTGAFFGLADLVILVVAALGFHGDSGRVMAPIMGPEAPAAARPAPNLDLEALARRAQASLPGGALYYVGLQSPGTLHERIDVEVSVPGRLPRGEDVYFDGQGREIGRSRYVTGPLGLQAYSSAAHLHFGFFGGLPVRLAYVALGCALSFISASGVTIWLARRADRGRPAPRLRGLWMGWTWGVPAALLACALASPLVAPPLVFWPCAIAAPLAGLAGRRPLARRR